MKKFNVTDEDITGKLTQVLIEGDPAYECYKELEKENAALKSELEETANAVVNCLLKRKKLQDALNDAADLIEGIAVRGVVAFADQYQEKADELRKLAGNE